MGDGVSTVFLSLEVFKIELRFYLKSSKSLLVECLRLKINKELKIK